MNRKCTQIALGGVFSALCLLLMFMTGLIPFATYALPALSGAMLIAVVEENGRKTSTLVYTSVSLLSLFIVPDRESAMMFIVFFGYYPIIREKLSRLRPRPLSWLCKLILFNATMVGGALIAIYVLGLSDFISGTGDWGKYSGVILLGAGNLVFLLYDHALQLYTRLYITWFKPTFLRR